MVPGMVSTEAFVGTHKLDLPLFCTSGHTALDSIILVRGRVCRH